MSKLLKDPAVVEHVEKQSTKAAAQAVKAAVSRVDEAHKAHVETLGDDKAAVKVANAHHKALKAALKA
jgi:hypothetical protein